MSDEQAWREMFKRAETRWMSVEDSKITVSARDLALVGRRVASLEETLRDVPVAYETKVMAVLEHYLPAHSDPCDEGWTQCRRCKVIASIKVAFGFSRPLNSSRPPEETGQ